MSRQAHIRLTSAEVGNLWTQYMNDTLSQCMLAHFAAKAEDQEVAAVIEYAYGLSQKHIQTIKDIYATEAIPIPVGFKQADIDVNSPRLFSDSFVLYYIKSMGTIAVATYGLAATLCTREDTRSFYDSCVKSSLELNHKVTDILLSKGLYVKPPYVPAPDGVAFVNKQDFLGKFLGKNRPLTAMEVTNLYSNIQNNSLGRALSLAFSQVARSGKVRDYCLRAKDIAAKHAEVFRAKLIKDDLPTPMTWDSEITTSTFPAFSDRLMMFHINVLMQTGVANYGASIATSARADLSTDYARLMLEVVEAAEDGANLMIDNAWLEQPPLAADRAQLAMH